jgi:hypothetical protein
MPGALIVIIKIKDLSTQKLRGLAGFQREALYSE